MKLRTLTTALIGLLGTAAVASDHESASIGWSLTDDGGCAKTAQVADVHYDRERGPLDITARIAIAPTGGNCEQRGVAYNITAERRWATGWQGWDAALTLGADKRAVGATYGLLDDDGLLLTRGDGGPAFATILPAGQAETVTAAIGIRRQIEQGMVVGLGTNFVPVDWADGSDGQTIRASLGIERYGIDLEAAAEFGGGGAFGDAMAYRDFAVGERLGFRVHAAYAWGLDQLDPGAPAIQAVGDSDFGILGAPSSTRWEIGILVNFGLD